MTDARTRILRQVALVSPFVISAFLIWPETLGFLLEGVYNDAADFDVFYSGAGLFAEGRYTELWDATAFPEAIGRSERPLWYAYPPFYARAWQPLTTLSIDAAFVSWSLAGIAAVPVMVRLLTGRWDWPATVLGVASYPAAVNFGLGQNAVLAALIMAAAVALVRSDRPLAGGAVLGLLVYKPQLAIGIGVWWLVDRRYRKAGLAAMGSAALIVGVSWLSDTGAWSAYLQALSELAQGASGQHLQVSMAGFLDLLVPNWSDARMVGLGVGAAILGAFAWWVRKEPPDDVALLAAVLVTFLAAPYLLIYDYLIALAPAAWFLRHRGVSRLWVAATVMAWAMMYTYVIRGTLLETIGIQLQVLPLATLLMLWSITTFADPDPARA